MKKKITVSLLLSMAVFLLSHNLYGQRIIRGTGVTTDMLILNNQSVKVNNLFVMDSIYQAASQYQNEVKHFASFEIELATPEAIGVLKALYAALHGQTIPVLICKKLDVQRQVVEERSFSSVIVKEIHLPELNTALTEIAKAKVIIQAQDALYNFNPGGGGGGIPIGNKNPRTAASNRFRFMMDNLPTQRISWVSSLKVTPSSDQQQLPGYLYFSIDMISEDIRQWNHWFKDASRGVENSKNGLISLLDETGQQEILSIQLQSVDIVSIAASNAGGIAKTTIGLRTRMIPVIP